LQSWNLFLISLGCLLIMLNANARTGEYNLPVIAVALIFIIIGAVNFYKMKKREKKSG